eukprot:COSAG01_NODE_3611_length_5872_cov_7.051793_3_plen_103_part_00
MSSRASINNVPQVTAEMQYWRWRYLSSPDEDTSVAGIASAERAKRALGQYVHICDNLMPGRGWTAKQEAAWLAEVTTGTRGSAGRVTQQRAQNKKKGKKKKR